MISQKKNSLYSIRFAILMLLSMFLVASVFMGFSHRIDRQIEINTHQRIDEYAVRQKNYITTVLESRYSLLSSFATYFGDELFSNPEAFDKLARTLLRASDFEHLFLID